MIHLNDIFHTVQGEGANVGRRALFVRMPFCNLACSWCDTSFNSFQEWTADQFLEFVGREQTRFAVITGGEPTMHKHTPKVISYLKTSGFTVAIETNGHFPIPPGVDWICCSPKRDPYKDRGEYFVHPKVWRLVHEFKYVVDDGFDFSLLDRHCDDSPSNWWYLSSRSRPALWLSPEHTNWKRNVDLILKHVARDPRWRLNLQTHKMIGVP